MFKSIRILRKKIATVYVLTLSLLLRTFFVRAQRSLILSPFCSTAKVISPWKCFMSQDHSSIFFGWIWLRMYPIDWKTNVVMAGFYSPFGLWLNGSNNIWFFSYSFFCSYVLEMFEEITFPLGPRALKGQWMICAPDIIDEDKTQNYCIKFYVTGAII